MPSGQGIEGSASLEQCGDRKTARHQVDIGIGPEISARERPDQHDAISPEVIDKQRHESWQDLSGRLTRPCGRFGFGLAARDPSGLVGRQVHTETLSKPHR